MKAEAPLQRIALTCSRAVGYFVAPVDVTDTDPPLLAGALRIPVASLSTGSPGVDELPHSLLQREQFPEITFRLTSVRDSTRTGGDKGRKDFKLTLLGDLTVKEKTLPLELSATVSLIPFTWANMGRTVGDLLLLRTTFDVSLADLGLKAPSPMLAPRMPTTAQVDVYLLCNTMSPETSLDPHVKSVHYVRTLKFLTLARDFNQPEAAYDYAREFMRDVWTDAAALDRLATTILTEDGVRTRDLGVVLTAAERANELTDHSKPGFLATVARAYYERGELGSAVRFARAATEHLDGVPPAQAEQFKATLAQYEAAQKKAGTAPPTSSSTKQSDADEKH